MIIPRARHSLKPRTLGPLLCRFLYKSRTPKYTSKVPLSNTSQWVPTLDSTKLDASCYLNLSGWTLRTITFGGVAGKIKIHYTSQVPVALCFPQGSDGFLYHCPVPGPLSPVCDSVRFRVTSVPSLEGFHQGQDLRSPNGLPWQIMIGQIASVASLLPLRTKLIHDDHLKGSDFSHIGVVQGGRAKFNPSCTLFSLDQPFELVFDKLLTLHLVGRLGYQRFTTRFHTAADDSSTSWPFSGSAVARFERSTDCPDTVVMRVLTIVKAVQPLIPDYTGPLCMPIEGDLIHVKDASGQPRPWSIDLRGDSPNVKALKDVGKRFEYHYERGPEDGGPEEKE
ncbi:hypothetical protein C8R44DRAFT_813906 [Mycena epipterygia]|nr:hypothetical protein C8R44DRAFT_813906 [Mycena epipterygia]